MSLAADFSAQRNTPPRRFRVLDECDEMLNMGFVEDVEKILGAGSVPAGVQTLLFSATLPAWVKDITARFLRPDHRVIDLVGNQRMKVRCEGNYSPWLDRSLLQPSARSTTLQSDKHKVMASLILSNPEHSPPHY